MGSKQVICCSTITEANQFSASDGYTLVIAEEGEIKRWENRSLTKVYSYEDIVQTLILGCFPDQL